MFRGRPAERDEGSAEDQDGSQASPTSATLTLTQEELDRRIQAETDRREAKRAAQQLADRRRKLRDEDPWAYAEEDRKAETTEQSNEQVATLFSSIGAEHDKYTLDPLVQSLSNADRDRILALEGAGLGLDGRKLIVTEALKALEKHWKAEGAKEAEGRLRRNPAFRKQLLGEIRANSVEPAFVGGGAAASSESDHSVSDILRQRIKDRHNTL